ncbi:hypothetical protein [Sphingomonas jatrophae]|uniref:DUF2628 domain-containing protein n=1 Tax=Sphingomonas jatrophae TaxID=1166337 RepID=A0A1I6M0D5_9SPHN|nr:hypothetical protein [Sphingomonas jatrophae]SFS09133.1 hypothetical protein SAMN05192580_3225 [Sphingomonas jatrophae]
MISGPFIREKTWAVFENPANGYREAIPRRAWLWMLLFGVFYLMIRQSWKQAGAILAIAFVATFICVYLGVFGAILWPLIMISIWIFYTTNIRTLLAQDYLRRGWSEVDLEEATIELPY